MKLVIRRLFVRFVRLVARILASVQVERLDSIPTTGAAILVANHINALEPLLLYALMPRQVTALSKIELFQNPLTGILVSSLDAIPIRRGELDLDAIRKALRVLDEGGMMGVAPEGTRSHHGRLQRGRAGAVMLALHAPQAIIVPAAVSGQEHFVDNLRRARRTPIRVVIGHGFYLDDRGQRITHAMRQQMADEIMMQVAALLPPENRGVYSDLSQATEVYLGSLRDRGAISCTTSR